MNLTLLKRFFNPTPAFEKTMQVAALILIAIFDRVAPTLGISPAFTGMITGVLAGAAFALQFAAKDIATYQAAASPWEGILDVIKDLGSQFLSVKDAFAAQSAVHGETLAQIAATISTLAPPEAGLTDLNTAAAAPAPDPAPVAEPAPAPAVPFVPSLTAV